MSFPQYPEYKKAKISWLDEMPSHWRQKRLRFAACLNPSKAKVRRLGADALVSFLPMEAVGEDGSLRLEELRRLDEVIDGYTYFEERDVGIAKITPCFENGKAAIMEGLRNRIGFGTTELTILRAEPNIADPSFLYRLVTSEPFRRLGESAMYGAGGQKRVPDDFVRNFRFALPPIQEQQKIAEFLDYETARIDELIENQKHLIELLKEKRQAVISHAVTKGLNPDVMMKYSGVEWTGEVPTHWNIIRSRYLFGIKKRIAGKKGLDVLSITQNGVIKKDIDSGEGQISSDYSKYQIVKAGDFAMNHMDLLTGWIDISPIEGVTSPDYRVFSIKNHDRVDDRYILYVLQLCYKNKAFYAFGQGSAHLGRWRLPTEEFRDFQFPIPPYSEQKEIAEHLKAKLGEMEALQRLAFDQIGLLKERRSALISDAVTGEIDIRGWRPQPDSTLPAEAIETAAV